jgi:N-acetylglucosaminyldiphosphoundecaprenol N-acetyl-beta-D-mannosaminyltransferase
MSGAFEPVWILGVPIHPVSMAEALAWVQAAVTARLPRQVCTANPEFVMAAQHDDAFRQVLQQADLVLPDGTGLLWAGRWLGRRLPERVAGSDLIYRLAERGAALGWRIYYLGAAEGVAERAAASLAARWPGLVVAGTYAGSPRPEDEGELVARVRAAAPDVLLVAYGAPAQDKWIARNRERLAVPVSMGVGGAFDFVAGTAQRAPAWLQRLGLEWLHRLWRQPWRAGRIANAVIRFPLAVLRRGRRLEAHHY